MTKTNTDDAYRRYCAEWGMCNRVVFDAAYRMGRSDNATPWIANVERHADEGPYAEYAAWWEWFEREAEKFPDDCEIEFEWEVQKVLLYGIFCKAFYERSENEQV